MLVIMYSAYGKAFWYGSKLIVDGMSSPKSIKWKLHCIMQYPNKQKGNNKIHFDIVQQITILKVFANHCYFYIEFYCLFNMYFNFKVPN